MLLFFSKNHERGRARHASGLAPTRPARSQSSFLRDDGLDAGLSRVWDKAHLQRVFFLPVPPSGSESWNADGRERRRRKGRSPSSADVTLLRRGGLAVLSPSSTASVCHEDWSVSRAVGLQRIKMWAVSSEQRATEHWAPKHHASWHRAASALSNTRPCIY